MKRYRNGLIRLFLAILFVASVSAPTTSGEASQPTPAAEARQINGRMVHRQEGPRLTMPGAQSSTSATDDMLFDFGTPTSPVEPEWTQVTPTTLYSEAQGYGWVSPVGLSAVDQGSHDPLDEDYVAGTAPTAFRVNLPIQYAPYEIWLLVNNLAADVPSITATLQNGWDNPAFKVQLPWMRQNGTYYPNLTAMRGIPTTAYYFAIWGMQPYLDIQFAGLAGSWQINALAVRQQSNPVSGMRQYSYEATVSNAHTAPATKTLPVFTVPSHFWYNSQKFGNAQADWDYVKDWIDSFTNPDMTPDEKFHAVMVAMRDFNGPSGPNHPVEVLVNHGGFCTGLANLETMAAWILGLPARNIVVYTDSGLMMPLYLPSDPYHLPEGSAHEVSEVYLEGEWHMIENNGDEYSAFDDFLAEAAKWGTFPQNHIHAARTSIYHGYDGVSYWASVYSPSTSSIIYPNEPDHQYRLSTHDPRQPGLLRLGSSVRFDGAPIEIKPGINALRKTFWLSSISPDVERVVTRLPFTRDYAGSPLVTDWYLTVNGHEHLLGKANTDWGANTGQELELEIPVGELAAGWNVLELGAHTPNSAEGLWVNTSTDVTNLTTTVISGTQNLPSLDAAWFMDLEYSADVDPGPPDPPQALQAYWSPSVATVAWTVPGDDWGFGQPLTYEVRYASAPIVPSNWTSAALGAMGTYTQAAGTLQTAPISVFAPNATYYVALKSYDEAGNVSRMSDNVLVSTWPVYVYLPVLRHRPAGQP